MKMSNREKIMVVFLLIAAIIGGSYYLILAPQFKKMDTLKADQNDLRVQVRTVEAQIASLAQLRTGVTDMLASISAETKEYFPSILTEKLLLVMNDLLVKNGMVVKNTTFSAPQGVQPLRANNAGTGAATGVLTLGQIREALLAMDPDPNATPTPAPPPVVPIDDQTMMSSLGSLTGMTVTLDFSAPYESLVGFLGGLESLQRSLAVSSITVNQNEDGTISGSVTFVFYALPKLTDADEEYIAWPYTGEYGKPNPFAAPGYNMTVSVAAFAAGVPNIGISVPAVSPTAPLLLGTVDKNAEVQLVFAPGTGGFTCQMKIGADSYPATGAVSVAAEGNIIRVLVASNARVDEKDVSGITLAVSNTTASTVQVTVVGDDPILPRVTIGTLTGTVVVQ